MFVGKPVNELRMEIGAPSSDYISENGNEITYENPIGYFPTKPKFILNTY